jgi:hypothetical protein
MTISPIMTSDGTTDVFASFVIILVQIFVRHLPKSAQHKPAVENTLFEIAGPAERNGAGVTEQLPLSLRRLDGERRACAVDAFAGNEGTVDKIEGQCHKLSNFSHQSALSL